MLHLDRREPELALEQLASVETFVAEQRLGFVLEPQLLRGAALIERGELEDAVACLREGLGGRIGATRMRCYGLHKLADVLIRQGDYGSALGAVRDAKRTMDQTGHCQWAAELHRLEGVALINLGQRREGQTAMKKALYVARQQKAKSYELRTALILARLWGEHGRRSAARALLAPIHAWFSEGHGTAELSEAKELLNELS
jgi:predicted negative regulator of RcsB-dependent stress response